MNTDEHGRREPPATGDETAMLLAFLDYHRENFAWKCLELDACGLNTGTAASTMTFCGMMKQLALVEDAWFSRSLFGHDRAAPWDAVDQRADPDWEWRTAAEDSPDDLAALWEAAFARSRQLIDEDIANGGA